MPVIYCSNKTKPVTKNPDDACQFPPDQFTLEQRRHGASKPVDVKSARQNFELKLLFQKNITSVFF